ncbi:pyruvate kinase [Kangiella sediminilitoris]|uniref:Pyruvate kinase n=1 Tax=Kangiella sediminilitoris TaxID=1144748 RepID=A0A1B3BA52_9GAMM|nr:pyruvate kinase [Kangiella sediminilitoris]AOE49648.1 pyruvate kinase [Kangiella sediminilitoris]
MLKRTKIVATLGPATDTEEAIRSLIEAGANVFRLNFSHGEANDHIERANKIRKIAKDMDRYIGILGDLQGPKIRISKFKDGKVNLKAGDTFTLDAELGVNDGDSTTVGIDYKDLPRDVTVGNHLMLDDGRIQFEVTETTGTTIICKVIVGGVLSNNKGINLLGGGLSAPALTQKDKDDIYTAVSMSVDYLAVSFPRSAEDMEYARHLLYEAGGSCALVAKIERAETVNDDAILDEIILASDAVMVARGDLGVEIGDAQLIGVQKKIIDRARTLNRVVITATQMMESMIHNPIPTRAEVFDVANAILDGTDAVMLSAETATGDNPARTVDAMANVCMGAENQSLAKTSSHRMDISFDRIDETIAMAAMYSANHLKGVKAIIALTESGSTALWLSRIRSGIPIFALSRNLSTLRKVSLYRGVEALEFDPTVLARHDVNRLAVEELVSHGYVNHSDLVIITKGDSMGTLGGTNAMKIVRVGEVV